MAETIFATATAPGRAAVAVVRLSGPRAHQVVAALCAGDVPADRRLRLRRLKDGRETLDEALVACFPAGGSYTGEAAAELHLHGGPAVVASVLRALSAQPGLRLAQPGEFSRRAFEAGRLDLAQVEAVADLVDARTEAQRRRALRAMEGALAVQAADWRARIVGALALIEAGIDFADEDIPDLARREADGAIAALAADLDRELRGAAAAQALREGFTVAVVGPPNAGKSSLFNALLRRDAALVSPVPGTTRDVLEAVCDIGGLPVQLLDTAGLRDSDDPIEQAGVARARARAATADLRLIVTEGDPPDPGPAPSDIVVASKADLGGPSPPGALRVSSVTGEGVAALAAIVAERLSGIAGEAGAVANARQASALGAARQALLRALAAPDELAAEALRDAARALDALIGRVDAEDVLDDIFARFCLGK